MSSSKLNQETELNDIVNKRNKWLFCNIVGYTVALKRKKSVRSRCAWQEFSNVPTEGFQQITLFAGGI